MYWRSLMLLIVLLPFNGFSDTVQPDNSVGQSTADLQVTDSQNLYDRQRERNTNPLNTTRSPYNSGNSGSSFYSSPYNNSDQSSYYYYNPQAPKPGTSDNSQYYYQWDNYQNPR